MATSSLVDSVDPDTGQAPLDHVAGAEKRLLAFSKQIQKFHDDRIKWNYDQIEDLRKQHGNTRLATLKDPLQNHASLILNDSLEIINSIGGHDNAAAALAQIARQREREIVSLKQELQALKAAKFDQLISTQLKTSLCLSTQSLSPSLSHLFLTRKWHSKATKPSRPSHL